MGISYELREVILIMKILKDINREGFPKELTTHKVMWKVFEDNSGALEISTVLKNRNRTNHLNVKHLQFRYYVTRGLLGVRHKEDSSRGTGHDPTSLNHGKGEDRIALDVILNIEI